MLHKIRNYYSRLVEESLVPNESYLTGVFFMCKEEELEMAPIQFDFYHVNEKVMTSFRFEGEDMIVQPKSEVFVENGMIVSKLDVSSDLVDFDQVYLKAKESLRMYNESVDKLIVVLQNVEGSVLWNITLLTPNFNMFNVRINAVTLEILKQEYSSLLNFKK